MKLFRRVFAIRLVLAAVTIHFTHRAVKQFALFLPRSFARRPDVQQRCEDCSKDEDETRAPIKSEQDNVVLQLFLKDGVAPNQQTESEREEQKSKPSAQCIGGVGHGLENKKLSPETQAEKTRDRHKLDTELARKSRAPNRFATVG
jgi:hypothetical protein